VTYNAPNNRFYVGAFAKNLEDNVVVTSAFADGFNGVTFADPRQFGLRAGVKF
jgi:iron complex outermembrane receptor protein